MLLILVGEREGLRSDRPIYIEIRIAPENTRIMARAIIGGCFVENLGFIFQCAKAVQKAR